MNESLSEVGGGQYTRYVESLSVSWVQLCFAESMRENGQRLTSCLNFNGALSHQFGKLGNDRSGRLLVLRERSQSVPSLASLELLEG